MKKIIILLLCLFCNTIFVFAQDTTNTSATESVRGFLSDDENWMIEVPIWIPGFRGNFVYGDVSLEGEDGVYPPIDNPIEPEPEPPDDGNILSRFFSKSTFFRFFFMGRVGYELDKYIFQFDAFSGGIGHSINFRYNNKEIVKATYTTAMGRVFAGYSLYEHKNRSQTARFNIIGYLGGKFHWVELYSDLERIGRKLDIDFTWAQPIFGIQFRYTLKNWFFKLQGDIGGYFTKENYSSMIHGFIYYRISGLISAKFGWTDWDINHERTIFGETFIMNVHLSGPNTGIIFHF